MQPPVLVDAPFQGRARKLLLHADRNGFFYVLDRTNGELLLAKAFARKITWASGIDAKGRPDRTARQCPHARGDRHVSRYPRRRQLDVHGVQPGDRPVLRDGHRKLRHLSQHAVRRRTRRRGRPAAADSIAAASFFSVPGAEPPHRYLRALDIQTGKVAWEIEQKVPDPNYGGVLSTAGGLVFYSESSGAFAAVDAATGRPLWHFETGQPPKASPMTYMAGRPPIRGDRLGRERARVRIAGMKRERNSDV